MMSTTLTELHRNTAKIIGEVVHGRHPVTIQIHGKDAAKIVPLPQKHVGKRMVAALRKLEGLELPER